MTSCTVLRSFSWSSGISTPNLSCAATAISTIDSESMSRSSTNVFSGVTSSAGTPATSSMISPRPARISCSVMAIGVLLLLRFSLCCGWMQPCEPGRGSGYRDHLGGVAHASAEANEQRLRAGGDLAALDHAGQRERDRRRRRVPGGDDVVRHDRLG